LTYLYRAADPVAGKNIYINNCQSCHGDKGQGQLNYEQTGYSYPPLWGEHSYNDGAGLDYTASAALPVLLKTTCPLAQIIIIQN
jgi:thiosulfate dehydrogenase